MIKKILLVSLLLLGCKITHAQTVQCQASSGAWGPCPLNASVQLFSATSATGTATSTAQKVYNFSMNGTLVTTFASITGSPATCTVQVKSGDSLGNLINNGSALSETVSNGTTSAQFTPAAGQMNGDQIEAVWACGTYPTTGTVSLEFVPATISVPVDANGYLKISLAAAPATVPVSGTFWQATQPVSIASLPGLAAGSNNIGAVNIFGHTGATLDAALNAAVPANAQAIGCEFLTSLPTVTTGDLYVAQCDSSARLLVNVAAMPAIPAGTNTIGKVDILGNAGAAVDQAPGSPIPANAIQVGATDGTDTRVEYYDPCKFNAWTYYPINVSANTQVVAGSSGKNVFICKEFIQPVAAAANVEIVESATSGNACATSPTGMMGGATAATGGTLAVNGGFVLPADGRAWAKTATSGDALCIFTSAAVTGVVAYVQF